MGIPNSCKALSGYERISNAASAVRHLSDQARHVDIQAGYRLAGKPGVSSSSDGISGHHLAVDASGCVYRPWLSRISDARGSSGVSCISGSAWYRAVLMQEVQL